MLVAASWIAGLVRPPNPVSKAAPGSSDIDLVVTWVDGEDEQWLETKATYAARQPGACKKGNTAYRFQNYNEIVYLLRSVDMYAPWIRKVHLVVADGQWPAQLVQNHPRLCVVPRRLSDSSWCCARCMGDKHVCSPPSTRWLARLS